MTKTRILLTLILISLLISCSVTKEQKQGTVSPNIFHQKTEFLLYKSLILVPCFINSEPKNFIFDTGAELSIINSDSLFEKNNNVSGASGQKLKMGVGKVKSIKIGNVEFENTNARFTDLSELEDKIPDFGGLIGQSIIEKSNWLIDYPNKKLEISKIDLSDKTFTRLEIVRKGGSPFTFITINGKKYKAIIDLGSTSALSIPKDSDLAKNLLMTYEFKDIEKDNYTIGGGIEKVNQKIGNLPTIELSNIKINKVETMIKETTHIRIGSGLFKNYILYIDNTNKEYKLK